MNGRPLDKRHVRELHHNPGKYLGLFLMMTISIAFVAGFLLSASSIQVTLENVRDAYKVEDGRFSTDFEVKASAIERIEELGCTVYENFSHDAALEHHGVQAIARVYANRNGFDEGAYAAGKAPEKPGQVALDRVFMANNDLHVGDEVLIDGRSFEICGICTLPDYQALFERNSDFVFNGMTFTIAQVVAEDLDALADDGLTYTYSFSFDDRSLARDERVRLEEDMVELLSKNGAVVNDLVDSADNQAIGYALDDVEGDQVIYEALLFILVVIMAFVFVVLTGATIEAESAVIGTLLASGYRKREITAHYLVLPTVVGLAAAVCGVVLGFTLLADPMKDLYYNSYSLPPFEPRMNLRVVVITAVLPFVLLEVITSAGLLRKMHCTPLQFLRHETGSARRRRSLHLPQALRFTARFRLRVLLRNLSHFVTLFFGIMFASLLMLFGTCMMPTVDNYANSLKNGMLCEHLYLLKAPLELDGTQAQREAAASAEEIATSKDVAGLAMEPGFFGMLLQAATVDADEHAYNSRENSAAALAQAEKLGAATLEVERQIGGSFESITVYGVQEGSRYWSDVDVTDGRIVAGGGLVAKAKVVPGEASVFENRYTGDSYELVVDEKTESETDMALYLSLDTFNKLFGNDADYFNGWASDEELDLDPRYVASVMTPSDMDKISVQMHDSMGDMVQMLLVIAVPIFFILVYLLTKTVIDRSARPISYMKVFGYRNREVNRLYIRSITIAVVASLVASLPLVVALISALLRIVFMSYNGNFPIVVPAQNYALVIALGSAAYAVVAVLHVRRVRKVPLALALKVQE